MSFCPECGSNRINYIKLVILDSVDNSIDRIITPVPCVKLECPDCETSHLLYSRDTKDFTL